MIEIEKREFIDMLKSLTSLPLMKSPEKISTEMALMYWNALRNREIDDIRTAINRHIQDENRGRFFPLPADIAAQLPKASDLWLTADEAWAMCPKNEQSSAAVCDEIMGALEVANELIWSDDMIAARRAFIDNYNRQVDEAKREGRAPKWWTSLGFDEHSRHKAEAKVIEMNNLGLPSNERRALPEPPQQAYISLDRLANQAAEKSADPEVARKHLAEIKKKLK